MTGHMQSCVGDPGHSFGNARQSEARSTGSDSTKFVFNTGILLQVSDSICA